MELELVMQLHSQPRIIVSCFSVVPAKIEEERLCASTCSCIYKLCAWMCLHVVLAIFVTYYGAVWFVRKAASSQAWNSLHYFKSHKM